MVTPELAVCGYPPEDLLLREDFMARCADAMSEIGRRVHGITLVVRHPRVHRSRRHNSASVLRDGKVVCTYISARTGDTPSPTASVTATINDGPGAGRDMLNDCLKTQSRRAR